jgi:proteasome lid subunit RPN8/RPN11
MWTRFARLLGLGKPLYTRAAESSRPKLLLTEACLAGLQDCLAPEMCQGHEGIAYLFGRTDGEITLAVTAFRPEAQTTPGSFLVEPPAMARGVRSAVNLSLQVVAQVHTHPSMAYHSDGDVEGARIRYPGYSSIVLPDYGRSLPRLDDAAAYFFDRSNTWVQLESNEVVVIPERVS